MGTGCSTARSVSMVHLNRENIPNFKIVLVGDCGVGKSNILWRYTKNQFDFSYRPTKKVVIENVVRKLNVPSNAVVSLTIWDIPGHEDMDLRATYYSNVDAIIVVVDLSDSASLELAGTWKQEFLNKSSRVKEVVQTLPSGMQTVSREPVKDFDPKSVPVLLLGNKYDLIEEQIQQEKMKKMLSESVAESKHDAETGESTPAKEEHSEANTNHQLHEEERMTKSKSGIGKKSKTAENTNTGSSNDVLVQDGNENDGDKTGLSDELARLEENYSEKDKEEDEEEKPECVVRMEKIEEECGFVASIAVSAKDKDGSIEMAVQSLIRHLLDRNILIKPHKSESEHKTKKRKKRTKNDEDAEILREVGIQELDQLYSRCYVPLKRSHNYHTYYDVCLKRFKQLCADQGYLSESKASLEDCIVGLRDHVRSTLHRELMMDDDEGFLKLYFEVDEKNEEDKLMMKQNRELPLVFDQFHDEYAAISKAILRDCPGMDAVLVKLDAKIKVKIEGLVSELDDLEKRPVSNNKVQQNEIEQDRLRLQRAIAISEKNRAEIAHTRLLITESMQDVDNAFKKIKAALIW